MTIYTHGTDRILEDQVLRIAVEERMKDELALRQWWATTGRRMGWASWKYDVLADRYYPIDPNRTDHRARLRLLVSMMRSVRRATR